MHASTEITKAKAMDPSKETTKPKAPDPEEESSRYIRWKKSTKALLSSVRKQTCEPYSIPVVPDNLRLSNESAYIPKVVSVGPQYKERRELLQAEEIKWRCVTTLLSRTFGLDAIENCMKAVLDIDETVRASYVDKIKLDRYDLATNIVFDGCFLLELIICESKYDSELPIPFNGTSPGIEVKKMDYVMSDLMLLDNQIPIYILEILFTNLLGSSPQMREFIQNLVLPVFGYSGKLMVKSTVHFLDIAYSYLEMEWIDQKKKKEEEENVIPDDKLIKLYQDIDQDPNLKLNLNRCATRLKAVGITIECLDVPDKKNFIAFTEFNREKRILRIPKLVINNQTEATWRSFIAWEHHKKKLKSGSVSDTDRLSVCTSSAMLFSDLICCTGDVKLLKDKGVIVVDDTLKLSNRDLVAYFHLIAKGVDRRIIDLNHFAMFDAMNTIPTKNYVTKVFIFLLHLFCKFFDWCYNVHEFFKTGYNYAFSIVGILTVVQTCYSVVAYHFPKK
ncbi:UPF0481 protein At3g47200-like [Vicia villosa]|uniref:UPF0481 protein At3g47200-like n=1 Tax=Vicia villosa TaxID=3911 RepID=UPI00273B4E1C|nr:UPF0481 protein At3g47200-like [Vicia villosa]